MTARRSSLLAFGLSLLLTSVTAGAVDPGHQAVPGDYNADGRLDALYQPLKPGARGAIVLQDGTGKLTVVAQDWDPGYLGLDWSASASTLTATDLNGDGQDDVLVQPVKAGGTAAVVVTDPTVQLLQITQLLPAGYLGLDWSSATHAIVAGDFDGDHQKELLLLAAKRGTAGALVHADTAGRLVAVMQPIADGFLGRRWNAQDENLYVGDFNGDGRADLLVQSRRAIAGESAYALLLADGDGRFSHIAETWNLKDLGADWDPANHRIVIEDANHDGIMDITLRSTDGGANYVFEGNTQGLFIQPAAHWTGNKSASDVLNKTGAKKSGNGISVIPSGPSAHIITGPTNPEQEPTIPKFGLGQGLGGGQGGGTIMTTNAAGSMEGSAGVSGGTATYSIPIIIPPGKAGMQPSISLNYSSRGGNGEMGMGWSLSAGSQIHRCPATVAMDRYASGVTYSSQDRLCLDGQHLILTDDSPAQYGLANATYRTELDGFDLITESGDITDPHSSFTVTRKDDHKLRYGYGSNAGSSPNTVFTPSGAPAPLAWGLGMEVDTYNNSIIYNYSAFGAGEDLLTSIQYTGSGATAGNREVDFSYSTRADTSSQYLAGGLTMQTQVLSAISTQENGQHIRTYTMDYSTSAGTKRTLLAGVQECGGGGITQMCLPETTFGWNAPGLSFTAPTPVQDLDPCDWPGALQGLRTLSPLGDVNGDGYKDFWYTAVGCNQNPDGGASTLSKIYLMGPGGTHTEIEPPSDLTEYVSQNVDVDGDGRTDIVGSIHVGPVPGGTDYLVYSSFNSSSGAFDPAIQPVDPIQWDETVAYHDPNDPSQDHNLPIAGVL
ncbi:MAG TPA: FG-GAP-like repeat-containing protein, partial [Gammaproteobacteria bacterium]